MDDILRAAIYCRLSENRADDSEKVDQQEHYCRRMAEYEGWSVVGVFKDDNISGSKRKHRPEWERMWRAVEEGHVDIIVARDLSRLTRHPAELEGLLDRADRHGVKIKLQEGSLDLTSGMGQLLARQLAATAKFSVDENGRNQRLKQAELREKGLPHGGGARAFGLWPETGKTRERGGRQRPVLDYTKIREDEAALIRQGTEAILRGETLASVARSWDAAGHKTTLGNPWSIQTVKSTLSSYRNAGLLEHKGSIYGPAAWPPIVKPEDVAAVREILASKTVRVPANGRGAPEREQDRRSTGNRARSHLLSGVLVCHCGGRMNQKKMGENVAYSCTTCHKNIDYGVADERAVSYVVARLAVGDPGVRLRAGDNLARLTALGHEYGVLAEKQAKLDAVEDQIDYSVYLAGHAKIKARRDEIDAERARIRRADAIAALIDGIKPQALNLHGETSPEREEAEVEIRTRFEALTLNERVTVLNALGQFTVLPHPKGTRPTKESARHRIRITPLDPSTGNPYIEETEAV